MSIRADFDLAPTTKIRTLQVDAGQTVVEGRAVSRPTSDQTITPTAAGAAAYGIALKSGAAGDKVQVLIDPGAICKVKVGTGGATRDALAVVVADGLTNAGALGGGTVLKHIIGRFTQTGVVGDTVGFQFMPFDSVSA